jgi:arylformamidase
MVTEILPEGMQKGLPGGRSFDSMKRLVLAASLIFAASSTAQTVKSNIPYVPNGHVRHVLDIYAPEEAKNLPVLFWIHGGGWQTGDKTSVHHKPAFFMEKGFVFVSINHRFLPEVVMEDLVSDVATAFAWVQQNIANHGGDPQRIIVGGHSSGAQLAALICTDDRYLKKQGVPFSVLKGCVPVDGDTYDIPAMIETAETRRRVHGQPQSKFGHREKFGRDPAKHSNFSAVNHVAADKDIPPFLILHVADHPDNSAQAVRFESVLKEAGLRVKRVGAKETNHTRINAELGLASAPCTAELAQFVESVLKP